MTTGVVVLVTLIIGANIAGGCYLLGRHHAHQQRDREEQREYERAVDDVFAVQDEQVARDRHPSTSNVTPLHGRKARP